MSLSGLNSADGFDSFTVHYIRELVEKLIDYGFYGKSDREDLEQRFAECVLTMRQKYDPTRGKPTTFAKRALNNEFISLIRKTAARCRNTGAPPRSLNDVVRGPDGSSVELGTLLDATARHARTGKAPRSPEELAQLRLDLGRVMKELTPPQRQVAELIMAFMTQEQIAERLQISVMTVGNRMRRIYEVFRDHRLDEYLSEKFPGR